MLTIGQCVINGESLLHQSNILLRIFKRDQVPVDIRINELQILECILPSNQQIQERLSKFLLNIDPLIHSLPNQLPYKLVLPHLHRVRIRYYLIQRRIHEQRIIITES